MSNSAISIAPIFEFKAPYQLSEITDQIRNKMILAVAKILRVNESSIVLTFSSVILRRRALLQPNGVLVSVGLSNFYGSASMFSSRITLENLNAAMAAEGLESVLLITIDVTGNNNKNFIGCDLCIEKD
jgi:hypothetical protein